MAWDPNNTHASITLSNSDKDAEKTLEATSWRGSISEEYVQDDAQDKYYLEFEVLVGVSGYVFSGIGNENASNAVYPGSDNYSWGYFGNSGYKFHNAGSVAFGDTFTTGDIIGLAIDASGIGSSTGKVWWSKNNVWQASGDPANGTNPAFSDVDGSEIYAAIGLYTINNKAGLHLSSGDWTYSAPTGFVEFSSDDLVINDSYHEHFADNVTLIPGSVTVDDTYHEHFADNVTLIPFNVTINDSYHEHFADNVTLIPGWVTVDDTYHEHFADNVVVAHIQIVQPHNCYHPHYSTPDYALKLKVTSVIIDADLTIPFIQVETSFGMEADITIPMIEIEAEIVPRDEIAVDIIIPMVQIEAEIIHAIDINADIIIPMIQVEGAILNGNYIDIDMVIPMIEIDANIGFNNIITGSLIIPMIEVDAQILNESPTIILKHSRC